jgi:hypothetical protein
MRWVRIRHAQGTDIHALLQDDNPDIIFFGKRLTHYFFEKHKAAVKSLEDKFQWCHLEKMQFVFRLRESEISRPNTTNWRLRDSVRHRQKLDIRGSETNLASSRAAFDQIMDTLKQQHCGEVRVWPVDPDIWHSSTDKPDHWGVDNEQVAARGAKGDSQSVFSSQNESWDCTPNFDEPISTFVVCDAVLDCHVCLREVSGITLAEVLNHYCNEEVRFKDLYEAWLEGAILVRKRSTRGTTTNKRKLRSGSSWWQGK